MRSRWVGNYILRLPVDMNSAISAKYPADVGGGHSKFLGDMSHGNVGGGMDHSHLSHLNVAELAAPTIIPITVGLSSFFNLVVRIVEVSPEEKMVRVNARRIIPTWAIMQYAQPIRYGASMNDPRRPVGIDKGAEFRAGPNLTVSKSIGSARPQPTCFGFPDLSPEPLWKSWGKSLRRQILRSNFDLHTVSCLIVRHAPGCSNSAGALSFNHVLWESLA